MNTSEPTPVLLTVKANSGDYTTDSTNGIKYVTLADLGGGGGGTVGGATAANQVIGNADLAIIAKATNGVDYFYDSFVAAQNFTGASIGDSIIAIRGVDDTVIPGTSTYTEWYNDTTGLPLATAPTVGTQVTFVSTQVAYLTKLATRVKQDELIASQSVDPTSQETLAIGDTSAHSTSGTGFNKVFLTALDADCWVTFGTSGSDPTATRDSGILIPAGTVYYPIKLTTANRQLAVINNVVGVTGKLNVVWSL